MNNVFDDDAQTVSTIHQDAEDNNSVISVEDHINTIEGDLTIMLVHGDLPLNDVPPPDVLDGFPEWYRVL